MVTVAEAINHGRRAIRQREPAIVEQMLRAYDTAWQGVERELAIIERRIEEAQAAGVEVKPSWLRRQAWYQRVQASIEVEMTRFQDQALRTLHTAQAEAVALSAETAGLVATAAGVEAGIVARVNPGAMERWVSALQPDSPIRQVFQRYGPRVEQIIIDRITEGIGGGKGVRSIVNDIRRDAGPEGVQGRLHSTTRTEVLRAYRGANRDDFQRIGPDVIAEWEWLADKSPRTCLACLAYDGRRFPYREYPSRFHVACRCTIRPVVDPSLVPPVGRPRETGAEWLARQDEDVQRQILGTEGRWDLFRQGVPISEFAGVKRSRTWGDSLFVKPAGAVSVPTPTPPSIPLRSAADVEASLIKQSTSAERWFDDEDAVLNRYQQTSENLNGALREGNVAAWQGEVDVLDGMMNWDVPPGTTLYRGTNVGDAEVFQGLQPGSVLRDPAYMSTSLDSDISLMFAQQPVGWSGEGEALMFEIRTVDFQSGLYIDATRVGQKSGMEQKEYILPRNTGFIVDAIEYRDDGYGNQVRWVIGSIVP